ncbi:TIGR03915 family putative DNA repair protein [Zhouia sp. PK063]|uniref:TIGR03915 family putative DNA repair protein n=1 Tax=Zhouia sp. PK063 TaxID=3373602 RepID=UPI0037AE3155
MTILIYDGSFDGFLTAIFEVYVLKLSEVKIVRLTNFTADFFANTLEISTENEKAKRVQNAIEKKEGKQGFMLLFKAFLCEDESIETILFSCIQQIFYSQSSVLKNYSHPEILVLAQWVRKIGREKHRMDAFIRFRRTKDDVYFAIIEPDFNVLPLLISHFKNRYTDQKWCIYDVKRDYGLWYNLHEVSFVNLDLPKDISYTSASIFTHDELHYQELWKNYFDSVNIKSRKNSKLHQQHLPKRYWKYLSEKYVK